MNRREFIKKAGLAAALGAVSPLAGNAEIVAGALSGASAAQVTRRRYKDSALQVPLLGFGMMRLPRIAPDKPEVDYAVAEKMIDLAFKAGANYFDTAYMYHDGLSEKCVGDLLSKRPRDSYYLADKMPAWEASSVAEVEAIFQTQLKRCKTERFDFYLIHAVSSSVWEAVEKLHVYEFLLKKKEEGRIRKLGFSFHDSPELLKKVAAAHPWDFAQIQLNYFDWETCKSREQYEILTAAGIPVIVMEPLRGGALASLNPSAAKILKDAEPSASVASWALRYVASLPNVLCVLSGMSTQAQIEDNLKTFSPLVPLSDSERKTLGEALAAYRKSLAVPCTACRYCLPCPAGVEIPVIFGAYNQFKVDGNSWLLRSTIGSLPPDARPSSCVSCGACMRRCPQKINIPAELKKIDEALKSLSAGA